MRIAPAVGSSSPAMQRNTVVLPHPDGPSSTKNSPSRTSRDRSATACVPPESYVLPRPRSVTDAMPVGLMPAREPEIHGDLEADADGAAGHPAGSKAGTARITLRRLIEARIRARHDADRTLLHATGRVDHRLDQDPPADARQQQRSGIGDGWSRRQVGSLLHVVFTV